MTTSTTRRIVCLRCARIKQACDGGSPCGRCKRLDVDCEPNEPGGQAENAPAPVLKPARIVRTHTGCISCKKRRRKCDEQRPRCSDCRRLCLDCHYPPLASSNRKKSSTPRGSPEAATGSTDTSENPSQQPPLEIDQAVLEFDVDSVNSSADSNSWTELTELWPVTPQITFAQFPPDLVCTTPNPGLPLAMLSAVPDISNDEDKSLLNHYMKVVAGVLSRRDDRRSNPYLSKLLPMAFQNQLVMDAVLALSASHWRKTQPAIFRRGTIHQTNALQALAKLLPHIESDSADAALSATLLLCMIELFDGTSSHWKFHLDGARFLLSAVDKKSQWSKKTEFRTFYRQLYHYLDSATTISTCHPPLLEAPKESTNKDVASPTGSTRDDLDDEESLYGVPKSLFHFVDKINSLAYQRKFREDPIFENMFQTSASSIEKELVQWSQEHHLNDEPLAAAGDQNQVAVQHATRAFEQALQLRLHQVVNGYSLQHDKVGQCVQQILESIQEIRYGSALESSLIFPLVMAGSSCSSESERLIIRDRFLVMERTLGFRYIYTAHELVQRVWKQRDENQGSDDVNWAAIRYFQIPGLALV